MIILSEYLQQYALLPELSGNIPPWEITGKLSLILQRLIAGLDSGFIVENGVAIHKTTVIESGVIIKGPVIIGENCFIGSHSYLRQGVYLSSDVRIGPGCEIKTSIICSESSVAHFNFIGDSIIGSGVNFEAGSVVANHYNERKNKRIFVRYHGQEIDTGVEKFGALVGDFCRIGANAVLSPGTILNKGFVVKRLELIEQ
jgi:UDP-N-acetylglucosamine diphosphorylase / glucose-1-phosphate thymidylyltransferase / UDP-N-acetylgalactosamine diphosphorylase / glucosamine-1-phosphate N-acetyltransferase / galactosamine-1-phosphate N-acetyltransferase